MRILNIDNIPIIVVVMVILLGSYFRLVDLGNPGFWGDEETSSIPAKSLALGQGPSFVSGMEYRRALPHTYLMAWAANIWGTDKDLSYRVPSAIIGIATLLLVYFGSRKYFGFYVALVATTLLAFSEWHIILSRTARMYGPLLFFSTLFCFASLAWHSSSKNRLLYLIYACVFYAISCTFSFLAITVLPVLFLPAIFTKFNKTMFFVSLGVTTLLGVVSILYFRVFLGQPYKDIKAARDSSPEYMVEDTEGALDSIKNLHIESLDIVLILLGIIIGLFIVIKVVRKISFDQYPLLLIGFLISSLAYGLFITFGAIYGAFICILLMAIFLPDIAKLYSGVLLKLTLLIFIAPFLILTFNLYQHGFTEGLKTSLNYPFPYLLHQFQNFPGVIVLFFTGILVSLFNTQDQLSKNIKVFTIITIIPSAIFGLVQAWAPPRYFVAVYPLLLIVASYGLVSVTARIGFIYKSKRLLLVVLLTLPSIGILGGHGIPQAKVVAPSKYGALIYSNHLMGIQYPDHRSHGCFVKENLREGDIIVAEDALQMYWYVGKVDYWLRTPSNIDAFLYLDGVEVKDIYVNSKPTSSEVINRLENNSSNRIWVVTSGETQQYLDHFLQKKSPQRQWLSHISNTYNPVLNGRDGISKTYCLNCDMQEYNPNSRNYDCR